MSDDARYFDDYGRPPRRVLVTQSQGVSLGCGTLILIALIVMIFSGRGTDALEREIRELRKEVEALRLAINDQSQDIRQLRLNK